jgi:hypothetical protein
MLGPPGRPRHVVVLLGIWRKDRGVWRTLQTSDARSG